MGNNDNRTYRFSNKHLLLLSTSYIHVTERNSIKQCHNGHILTDGHWSPVCTARHRKIDNRTVVNAPLLVKWGHPSHENHSVWKVKVAVPLGVNPRFLDLEQILFCSEEYKKIPSNKNTRKLFSLVLWMGNTRKLCQRENCKVNLAKIQATRAKMMMMQKMMRRKTQGTCDQDRGKILVLVFLSQINRKSLIVYSLGRI